MPYIVTTRIDVHGDELSMDVTSRRAVATLDGEGGARFVALLAVEGTDKPSQYRDAIYALPEQGGTVGPLPDGTVIEVEQVAEVVVRAIASYHVQNAMKGPLAEVIDAYNAAQ